MSDAAAGRDRYRRGMWGLLGGNVVSEAGNAFAMLAIPWFVLATTGSVSQTGLVVAAGTIPYAVVGVLGGAIVDRVGARRTAIVSDAMSCLSVAAIPLLHTTVGIAFWQLVVLVMLGAALDGPGSTSRQAMYPEIVDRAGIAPDRANTWFSATARIAQVIGTPLAGLTIAIAGASNLLWFNAASFAIAALATWLFVPDVSVRFAANTASAGRASRSLVRQYVADLREGARYLTGTPLLLRLVTTGVVGVVIAEPLYGLLLPIYANEVLDSAAQLGFIFGALGAGSIIGNALYLAIMERVSRGALLVGGYAVRAICFGILLLTPPWWVIAATVFIGAVALEPINPMTMSIRQRLVPRQLRGRVFGTITAVRNTAYPVGIVIYSGLVSWLGITTTLVVFVVVNTLLPLAIAWQPMLRHLHLPEQVPDVAQPASRPSGPLQRT